MESKNYLDELYDAVDSLHISDNAVKYMVLAHDTEKLMLQSNCNYQDIFDLMFSLMKDNESFRSVITALAKILDKTDTAVVKFPIKVNSKLLS